MKNLTFIILISISINTFAQKTSELYMPKEIKRAYENGTRSYTGEAGENYFVNKIDYSIKAEFNPKTRLLNGKETITYTNNSSDSLEYFYFNIYQDIYKKGNMRDWDIGTADLTDGVQITKIVYQGQEIDINSKNIRNNSSILRIKLPVKLAPGKKADIKINWNLLFPGTVTIRMGTYNKDNFFIAYWFPKVAVYDDIEGWNTHGHSGSQEFYNDFGNYDIEIKVPGDYQIWATGILQNTKDLYTDKYIKRIEKSKTTEGVIHIITENDRKKANILKKSKFHTWKFKSEQTPDFAFAVSRTYLWDATSTQSGNKRISVNAVYKPDSKDFHEVAEISKNSINFFTEEIPGVPYPYPQFTAFNGGGGMEFPGMINDGDARNRNGTLYVTAHEIGHSYFPFYTGLNEQKYAWMDEGLITFFPQFILKKYTNDNDFIFFKRNIKSYNRYAGTFNDVPLMIPSDNVGRYAYRFQAYARSSVAFFLLYKYLGKEKFTKGLKLFTERWNGKHPVPYDFFFTFNEVAEENLAWFWKPWFFEIGYADLKIKEILNTENNETIIIIENKTGFPVPVDLTAEYKNGETKHIKYNMKVWTKGEKTYKVNVPKKGLKKLILNTETIPDAYPDDNIKELF
ncbi:MAG: M1 family metallopeptidase [Bacteroidales bacterium]|nr:M1 family metallopeptidase [Bacteroidales bacterium]